MALRFSRDLFDDEFYKNQELLGNLSEDLISIDFSNVKKSDDDLVKLLIKQNKGYARKIISLYEELSHHLQAEINTEQKEAENRTRTEGTGGRSQTGSAQKDKGRIGDEKDKVKHLENKIEYLNNLIVEMKKQSETKVQEPKSNPPNADRTNEKILFLNQTIAQLKDQNALLNNQNALLNNQKVQSEADIQELLAEFARMKKKYETELGALINSPDGSQIPPGKKLVDIAYVEELEAEIKKLAEQQEFSERLEDIDKYKEVIDKHKEVIAEREKKISNLQLQLELYQKSGGNQNDQAQYLASEMKVVIKNLQKEVNELAIKNKIDGHQTDMTKEDRSSDTDLLAQLQRCNSKLLNLHDALRLINEQQQQASQSKQSLLSSQLLPQPEDLKLLSYVVESIHNLKDQLESAKPPYVENITPIIRENSKNLSRLLSNLRQSQKEQPNIENASTKSPVRGSYNIKESYLKVQEEISGALRQSVNQLQQSNYNELTLQLQIQLEKNNELTGKIDYLTKCLHSLSLIVNEELLRCLYSIDAVAKIETAHNPALTMLNADLSRLKNRFQTTFNSSGSSSFISNLHHQEVGELRSEYDKQKGIWEQQFKSQNDIFGNEVRTLKDDLRKEQDNHLQTRRRLEDRYTELKSQSDLQISQYENSTSDLRGKLQALGANLKDAQETTELLQKKLHESEFTVGEREKSLSSFKEQLADLRGKLEITENDRYALQRENTALGQKLDEANRVLKEMQRRVELIEEKAGKLDSEKRHLNEELTIKKGEYEHEIVRLGRELEQSRDDLRRFTQKSEINAKEMKESYERLIEDYIRQLEQVRTTYEDYRAEKETELRQRRDESRQINLRLQTADEVAKTHEVALRRRDEKISSLLEEKNQVVERNTELERQIYEINSLRDKFKKMSDATNESKSELSSIRSENQALTYEKERLESRLLKAEKDSEERRVEIERLKQSNRATEVKILDHQKEIQTLKSQIEIEKQNSNKREKELRSSGDSGLPQSRASTAFKDEMILRLKEDVKTLSTEYEALRSQCLRLQEKNDELTREFGQKGRDLGVDKTSTFRDMGQLSQHNDNLVEEIQQMKRELQRKDEELFKTKRTYKYEFTDSQRKTREGTTRLGSEDFDRYDQRGGNYGWTKKERDQI